MPNHPALAAGRVAVVTGAASGIGLAAARRFASMGLKVCLADLSAEALDRAAAEVAAAAPAGRASVIAVPTDVSKLESVQALKDKAYAAFGEVAVLMNNAGTAPGGGPWDHNERWQARARRQSVGRHQRRADLQPGHAGAEDGRRHRQHRLQAGHHLPARRHRLQRQQGRREGADRGAGAQPAQRGGQPHLGASAGAGLDLHRHDGARPQREAAGRLDARPGRRHAGREHGQGRLLHHLPRQRGHARGRQSPYPVGGRRTSPRTGRRCRAGMPTTRTRSTSTCRRRSNDAPLTAPSDRRLRGRRFAAAARDHQPRHTSRRPPKVRASCRRPPSMHRPGRRHRGRRAGRRLLLGRAGRVPARRGRDQRGVGLCRRREGDGATTKGHVGPHRPRRVGARSPTIRAR